MSAASEQVPAGRQLDVLVARHLGWRLSDESGGDVDGERWFSPEQGGGPVRLPSFSTDTATAMALMQQLKLPDGHAVHSRFDANGLFSCWVGVTAEMPADEGWHYHRTFAAALCRAVVAAGGS